MFNSEELSMLTLDYFKVEMCASDVCELESQNGDHWLILKKQVLVPREQVQHVTKFSYTFLLFHRHSDAEGFHYQTEFLNVLDVILEIINHDDYRLKRRGKTFFDRVIAMYA